MLRRVVRLVLRRAAAVGVQRTEAAVQLVEALDIRVEALILGGREDSESVQQLVVESSLQGMAAGGVGVFQDVHKFLEVGVVCAELLIGLAKLVESGLQCTSRRGRRSCDRGLQGRWRSYQRESRRPPHCSRPWICGGGSASFAVLYLLRTGMHNAACAGYSGSGRRCRRS